MRADPAGVMSGLLTFVGKKNKKTHCCRRPRAQYATIHTAALHLEKAAGRSCATWLTPLPRERQKHTEPTRTRSMARGHSSWQAKPPFTVHSPRVFPAVVPRTVRFP
eukprot:4191234-Prymnesium_polylepis.2